MEALEFGICLTFAILQTALKDKHMVTFFVVYSNRQISIMKQY